MAEPHAGGNQMHHTTFALSELHRSELRGQADQQRLARAARSRRRDERRR